MKKYIILFLMISTFSLSACGETTPKTDYAFSGQLKEGIRHVDVEAFQYGFRPDPIVVKFGEKVRLFVRSVDVTHGISISEFKINEVLPKGKIKRIEFIANKKGTFTIHCSVFCGPGHGKMHAKLVIR